MIKKILQNTQIFKITQSNTFKFSKQLQNNHYDVVISGAGPVGSSLACALQKEQYFQQGDKKILLLDLFTPPNLSKIWDQIIPDHRVVSLNSGSVRFLESIGAWEHLDTSRTGKVNKVQVWENGGDSFLQFNNSYNNGQQLNYIVENNHITASIMEEIFKENKVEAGFGTTIQHFERKIENGNLIEIQLSNGQTITSNLIVGSEGRNSNVKKLSNIGSYGWSYNQKGIVCSIKLSIEKNDQSYQRYMQSGPLAILPLWEDYCSIVWSVQNEDHDYLIGLSDKQFMNELNQALTGPSMQRTPNLDTVMKDPNSFYYPPLVTEICNKRLSFPFIQNQSEHYISDGVALIGDAAHAIHPQAGQGLNNGLMDAASLANNIITNIRTGNNIGQEIALKGYEVEAKALNYATAMQMEAFQQIYQIKDSPIVFLRNLGVNMLNNSEFIKHKMQEVASKNPYSPKEFLWEKQ